MSQKGKAEGSTDREAPPLLRRERGRTGPLGCTCMGMKCERNWMREDKY